MRTTRSPSGSPWRPTSPATRLSIFDLFNEPFFYGNYFTNPSQDPWQCWLDGCSLNQFISAGQIGPDGTTTGYTTTYTWNTAGMQTLIDAIRAAGAAQPILVNGLDWANDDLGMAGQRAHRPDGQLIAGAHDYPGESCDTTSCWDSQQAPISASYPFLVGEIGTAPALRSSFLPTFLPYADSHGWSYLAWTWNPWGYTDDVLITDWSGTPNAGEGTSYQQHLLSLGSSPLPSGTGGGDAHADGNPHSDADAHPDADGDTEADSDGNPHPDADDHPDADGDTKPTVTATPTPTSAPKRETSTMSGVEDAAKTAAVTGALLYRDSFTSDATGTVPAGWSVTGGERRVSPWPRRIRATATSTRTTAGRPPRQRVARRGPTTRKRHRAAERLAERTGLHRRPLRRRR